MTTIYRIKQGVRQVLTPITKEQYAIMLECFPNFRNKVFTTEKGRKFLIVKEATT
jgi:hypothetical protein